MKKQTSTTEKKQTIQKHIQRLRKLARSHGGVLPTYSWLNKNGFFNSYEAARTSGVLKSFRRAARR